MPQQVTLKGLRIPHSGIRIPDSLPSTNPTKTWRTVYVVHVPPSSTPSSLGQNHSHTENSD